MTHRLTIEEIFRTFLLFLSNEQNHVEFSSSARKILFVLSASVFHHCRLLLLATHDRKRFMLKICINRFAKSFAFNSWSCSTEECCYSEEVSRKLKIFDNNFFEGYILLFFKTRNLISEAHNRNFSLHAGLKEFEFA